MNEQDLTGAVHQLILESVPERRDELENLRKKYCPGFAHASDEKGFRMEWKAIPKKSSLPAMAKA